MDGLQPIDHGPVDEAKVASIARNLVVRNAAQHQVKHSPPQREQRMLLAAPAQADNHVVSLLPKLEEFRYQIGRILQIAVDLNGGIARCVPISNEQRTLEPVVAVETDNLDPVVRFRQRCEATERSVFAVVVCENEFEIVARQRLE